ncbi:MAG: serine/threonine-protein kinase [Myxococcota bacterium]
MAIDEEGGAHAGLTEPTRPIGSSSGQRAVGGPSSQTLTDRYAREALIDEGGMGLVLLANDRHMKRQVAVKRLRSEYADRPDLRQRFLREARVQGQLEHPGVVPIYDVGVTDDGAPFFAMKRLQGRTLHDIINRLSVRNAVEDARFPLRRRIEIFEAVCQTIMFAHHRSVVHRDLKPPNIMVGEFGEVYVLDWGIAKIDGEDGLVEETRVGEQMGTPGYMAPEQAVGSLDVDERTDVFALGAVLFELLTLTALFIGEPDDKVRATIQGDIDAPIERAPLDAIPEALDAICRRATAFDPKERYADVRELHQAVVDWLAGARSAEERQRLAERYTRRAAELAESDPARAVRELSSALAVEPDYAPARNRLLKILGAPEKPSPEAEAALKERGIANLVATASRTYGAYAAYLPALVFLYLAGVRSSGLWYTMLGSLIMAAITGLWVRRSPSGLSVSVSTAFGFVVLATIATIAGPFSFASAMVVGNGAAWILAARANAPERWLIFSLSVLALALPFLLHLAGLGVLPYGIEDGEIVVRPAMVAFDSVWTLAAASLATVVCLAATYALVGQAVDRLKAAEREAFLRAWRLEQLVPSAAAEAGVGDDTSRQQAVNA